MPVEAVLRSRTWMRAGLFKVPLLGPVAAMVGHLAVHFRREDSMTDFSVDRDRMEAASRVMETHVHEPGNVMCLFPEGFINPVPERLATFRRGTFSLIASTSIPQWAFVTIGCNHS